MLLLKGKHLWEKGRDQGKCHSSPSFWGRPWINRKEKLGCSSLICVFVPHVISLGLYSTKDETMFIMVMNTAHTPDLQNSLESQNYIFSLLMVWGSLETSPASHDTSCFVSSHGLHANACQAKPHLFLLVPRFLVFLTVLILQLLLKCVERAHLSPVCPCSGTQSRAQHPSHQALPGALEAKIHHLSHSVYFSLEP